MTDHYTEQRNDLARRFKLLPDGGLDYARADAVLAQQAIFPSLRQEAHETPSKLRTTRTPRTYHPNTLVTPENFNTNPNGYIRPRELVTFAADEPTYRNESGMTWHVVKSLRTRGVWVAHMDAATKGGATSRNQAGRVPGFPDLLVIVESRYTHIELKLPDGHFTEAQLSKFPKLLNAGATIHVCLSELEVLTAVFGVTG